MCPLCIGTAWLIAGGVSSAGGVATVAWRSVAKRRRRDAPAKHVDKAIKPRRLKASHPA
ncbi:hypothetical protein FHW85_001206 [Dyella sp. SG609]|nr:hypothetical protein [Dyella sp. SG609]